MISLFDQVRLCRTLLVLVERFMKNNVASKKINNHGYVKCIRSSLRMHIHVSCIIKSSNIECWRGPQFWFVVTHFVLSNGCKLSTYLPIASKPMGVNSRDHDLKLSHFTYLSGQSVPLSTLRARWLARSNVP